MEAGEAKKIQDSSIELLFLYTNTYYNSRTSKEMDGTLHITDGVKAHNR